jgi:hypothetical protein
MSESGKFTSLGLNVYSGLSANSGFSLNSDSVKYQGVWTPDQTLQGEFVTNTVLKDITSAVKQSLDKCVPEKLSAPVWRKFLSIGQKHCPALGNTKTLDYLPTYAGYGTWEFKTKDQYGSTQPSQSLNLTERTYPPKNYGTEKTFSYLYRNFNDYAWVTGWPGKQTWQQTDDDFIAVVKVDDDELTVSDYDRYFSEGFVTTIARQAYHEFWSDAETRRPNQYKEFVRYMLNAYSWMKASNSNISTFVNGKTFLRGNYSNVNDLSTGDISGVNLSFKTFGNEMIDLGKSLDLTYIDVFGLPSKLLLTLQKANAITEAVKLAMLIVKLDLNEIEDILSDTYNPNPQQEKKIYDALTLIRNDDLSDIQVILNCATPGLESLADLINPIKMFPLSYKSLTVPTFSYATVSNKTYEFIYNGQNVNPLIQHNGEYLDDILPVDLAKACGAFKTAMGQVKNIQQMEFEKFAQVVANLEVTDKGLDLLTNQYGTPTNVPAVEAILQNTAFGSGNSNVFRFCDFLGAMSGLPYVELYEKIITELSKIPTESLAITYRKLLQKAQGNDWELLGSTSETASKLFKTETSNVSGTTVISVTDGVSSLLNVDDVIVFSKEYILDNSIDQYTVVSRNDNSITISPGLSGDLAYGNFIFKKNESYDSEVSALIDSVNETIYGYSIKYSDVVSNINNYWSKINSHMMVEQRAIPLMCKESLSISETADITDFESFIQQLPSYALETAYGEIAQVLEKISDLNTISGQSIIASLRQARNTIRITNLGGEIDNIIPDTLNSQTASAKVKVLNGRIQSVDLTSSGKGYSVAPDVIVYPQGGSFGGSGSGAKLKATLDLTTGIKDIEVVDPGYGYDDNIPPEVYVDSPDIPAERKGGPVVAGSLAGSPYIYQDPIPDNLIAPASSSYTVAEAVEEVDRCKCQC